MKNDSGMLKIGRRAGSGFYIYSKGRFGKRIIAEGFNTLADAIDAESRLSKEGWPAPDQANCPHCKKAIPESVLLEYLAAKGISLPAEKQ